MIPNKQKFEAWYEEQSLDVYPDVDLIYSFFSSSNDRVVEKVKKLERENRNDEGFIHSYNEALSDVLSLIQPKEDENKM